MEPQSKASLRTDLLIVRHAIAFERDAKRWPDDRKRPLTEDGMARARRAAKGLEHIAERPALLLTSPLVRASQTAAILVRIARWPDAIECPALAPGNSPEAVLEALRGRPERRIAIVGHQPDLGRLLATCIAGDAKPHAFELKKLGVALLSFDGAPSAGRGTLRWLLAPKLLRAMR